MYKLGFIIFLNQRLVSKELNDGDFFINNFNNNWFSLSKIENPFYINGHLLNLCYWIKNTWN